MFQASRKAQGLTHAALAARIGLSQSRASHLEFSAQEPSVEQLLAWCAVLGLELAVGTRGSAAVPVMSKTVGDMERRSQNSHHWCEKLAGTTAC
ncbi:helix-turn-helix domain-containing protein [Bordetella sp. N]|uniref:helix-turn-helix domain-containing protein n=1 Tax=Bordetella sp. N TaxID=1746199 RepID=UPI003517A7E4